MNVQMNTKFEYKNGMFLTSQHFNGSQKRDVTKAFCVLFSFSFFSTFVFSFYFSELKRKLEISCRR